MNKYITCALVAMMLSGCATNGWFTTDSQQQAEINARQAQMDNREMRGVNAAVINHSPAVKVEVLGEPDTAQSGNTFVDDMNFQRGANLAGANVADDTPANWNSAYGAPMTKNINQYVRGMMHKLVDNIHYINDKTPIGVVSFIFLDGNYKATNLLGNQIAESFMHEVHQFGIPVIDFKTTDYIRVTEAGDFVFSRDFLELKDELPIKYVLAGTLVKHQAGFIVNARIIGLTSKAIVASAQGFIPNAVADALMPSISNDGIMLMQGE